MRLLPGRSAVPDTPGAGLTGNRRLRTAGARHRWVPCGLVWGELSSSAPCMMTGSPWAPRQLRSGSRRPRAAGHRAAVAHWAHPPARGAASQPRLGTRGTVGCPATGRAMHDRVHGGLPRDGASFFHCRLRVRDCDTPETDSHRAASSRERIACRSAGRGLRGRRARAHRPAVPPGGLAGRCAARHSGQAGRPPPFGA